MCVRACVWFFIFKEILFLFILFLFKLLRKIYWNLIQKKKTHNSRFYFYTKLNTLYMLDNYERIQKDIRDFFSFQDNY